MAKQHTSWFSYNLTRPYPMRWFTPVTILGGILIAVLVSFLSVGTSGYQLIAISSTDPNATEAMRTWFGSSMGSCFGSLQPSCQSATIPVGTTIYTNNSALPYTITGVERLTNDSFSTYQGALVYHNHHLQNCIMTTISLEFESMQQSAGSLGHTQLGLKTTLQLMCLIETLQGALGVSLNMVYDGAPTFQNRNETTQPSLYYAESALQMFWISTVDTLAVANRRLETPIYKGLMMFSLHGRAPLTTAEAVESLDFFDGMSFFMPFSSTGFTEVIYSKWERVGSFVNKTAANIFPTVWRPADSFAKSLLYTVMVDLGQIHTAASNIFTSPDLLAHFTSDFLAINSTATSLYHSGLTVHTDSGLATAPFDPKSPDARALHISPSVLATSYLCQVPQLKPTASLIVAVLVADIVLLRTIWQIYKFVVDMILQSAHPEMNSCEACLRSSAEPSDEVISLKDLSSETESRGDYHQLNETEQSAT